MFVLKITHSDGNISLEPVGESTKVDYTKEGSALNNRGVKAYVYDPTQEEDDIPVRCFQVFFGEEAYVIEQGKTVCVVSYGN